MCTVDLYSFIKYVIDQSQEYRGSVCSMHRRREMHKQVWWENANERNYLEDQLIYGKIIIELILKKKDWSVLTEFMLHRAGTSEMIYGYLPNMVKERNNPLHHGESNKGNSITAHYLWVMMMSDFPCKHTVRVRKNSTHL